MPQTPEPRVALQGPDVVTAALTQSSTGSSSPSGSSNGCSLTVWVTVFDGSGPGLT